MNIWKFSIKNMKAKAMYTALGILTLALSTALLLGVRIVEHTYSQQMQNNLADIDMVIGAKGSPLQLVLSSVLHIDNPTGNINYNEALKISKNPFVKSAIPISYGDNYKGYRIVGSTDAFINIYSATYEEGMAPKASLEVVLGHTVASQLNLSIGDTFMSSHGLADNDMHVHNQKLKVVGILNPTDKVLDRLIITPLHTVWDMHERHNHSSEEEHHEEAHNHEHHEQEAHPHDHDDSHNELLQEEHDITAMLISFRNPMALLTLPRHINEQTNMQAALPKFELDRLFQFTGIGMTTISLIAYGILIISCLTIFINLFKMVKERSFELALLRTYGATNGQLITMVALEGFIIGTLGVILGFLFTTLGLQFLTYLLDTEFGQKVSFEFPIDLSLIIAYIFISIFIAIVLAVYPILRMNISTILSNET